MTRVSGVGSASPSASVAVKVAGYGHTALNWIGPGFCAVLFGAAPPKFHAYESGLVASGSVPVPAKVTLWPTTIVVAAEGVSIVPFGAWFTLTVTTRTSGVGSASPRLSLTVKVTV